MFFDERQVRIPRAAVSSGAGGEPGTRAALAALADMCRRASADIAAEVPIMEQIFPDPGIALALLVQRLFDQRILVSWTPHHQPLAQLARGTR